MDKRGNNRRRGERSNAELAALRLADPREYAAEKAAYQETLRQLDEILRPEGLRIVRDGYGRPELADADGGVMRVELKEGYSGHSVEVKANYC
jgi:hypothetical protein